MENFTLTGALGWQTLSSLLDALLPTHMFSGKYLWTMLSIKNTHASQTMIIKNAPGAVAPPVSSGTNLIAGGSFTWDAGNQGIIDGKAIWVSCSGAGTTFDITFIRKTGVA